MNPTMETGATEVLANLSIATIALIALVLTVFRLLLLRPMANGTDGKAMEIPAFARGIAEILESLIIAGVLVFLIIRPFFVQAFFIPSQSMENTLLGHNADPYLHSDTVHDHIFVNKLIYRYSEPKFGDIIVFRAPKAADAENRSRGLPQQENVLIKRLIGLPGDTIEVRDGFVYRNGKKLDEPYIKEPMDTQQHPDAVFAVDKPLKLAPDELFVMGDNRNDSYDSRYWGTLKRNRVIGKAQVIFWPLNRIRLLQNPAHG